MKRVCVNCGEEIDEKDNIAYSDNGVDQEPYLCEFCYMEFKKTKIEKEEEY